MATEEKKPKDEGKVQQAIGWASCAIGLLVAVSVAVGAPFPLFGRMAAAVLAWLLPFGLAGILFLAWGRSRKAKMTYWQDAEHRQETAVAWRASHHTPASELTDLESITKHLHWEHDVLPQNMAAGGFEPLVGQHVALHEP
jgi:hypothetical protein